MSLSSEAAKIGMVHGAIQKESELAWLLNRYVTVFSGAGVLEIGSAGGGTLWAWTAMSQAPVVSIDLPYAEYPKLGPHLFPPEVRWIGEDSHTEAAWRRLFIVHPDPFDLVFIDGDHSYNGAKADFNNYRTRVRPGGLLTFHDIAPESTDQTCFVQDFWRNEVVPYFDTEYYIEPPFNWGGIGVVRL